MPTVDLPPLKIDPVFQSCLPGLAADERRALEANMLRCGKALHAIIVWADKNIILDGHNRYAICQARGLPYKVEEMEFASRLDAMRWMIEFQDGRRNWTPEQKAYAVGKLLVEQQRPGPGRPAAASRSHAAPDLAAPHGNPPPDKLPHGEAINRDRPQSEVAAGDRNAAGPPRTDAESGVQSSARTSARIGQQHSVSHATAERAARFSRAVDAVAEVGGDELKGAILSGAIKSTRKDVEQLAALPVVQRRAAARRLAQGAARSVREAIERVARAAPAVGAAPVGPPALDRCGRAIPAAAGDALAANKRLEGIARELGRLLNETLALAQSRAGVHLAVNRIRHDGRELTDGLRVAKFHSLCPYCAGATCDHCKQSGWITASIYNSLPAELKAELKLAEAS